MSAFARCALWISGAAAFAAVSWIAFRGYLSPEMLVYFLSFRWCF
jgi:hypothetical protein